MIERNGLLDLATASLDDLRTNTAAIARGRARPIGTPYTVTWFLPTVPHALKGGVRTVFGTAQHLSIKHGTHNLFVIYSYLGDGYNPGRLVASLRQHFPDLNFTVRVLRRGLDRVEDLPPAQIAICTLWTTAYVMLRYNQTARKFYLLQDYEPMFYAGSDLSLAIEQTYRFGFSAIANTPGVGARYLHYSDDVVSFLPGVDRSVFYPPSPPRRPRDQHCIVFYGRPQNARNAFFLGANILRRVKAHLGDRVRILSAGAKWDPDDVGLNGIVENLGLLGTMKAVGDLYRSADLGLALMATPHPSYQPLEYMACGCVTATNINESNSWLLNAENALLLEPIADIAAERIVALLADPDRRAALVAGGLDRVRSLDWDRAYDTIERRLMAP